MCYTLERRSARRGDTLFNMPNRLAHSTSPYLLQHAANPINWWPWCPEAFAEARERNVPVLLSVGYAACHWCHVMAHESFEDGATAKLMNELFVNIKVDREERPDVDTIYMNAIQVMGEGCGWPLSAFCLPDGRPYFLGTYFPNVPRFGKPTFQQLLMAMADAFHKRKQDAVDNAMALVDGLERVDEHYRRGAASGDGFAIFQAGERMYEEGEPVGFLPLRPSRVAPGSPY